VLLGLIDAHPRTDLEYARAKGMHKIIDNILEYAGIFMEVENNGNKS
jgi:hypothetical protein